MLEKASTAWLLAGTDLSQRSVGRNRWTATRFGDARTGFLRNGMSMIPMPEPHLRGALSAAFSPTQLDYGLPQLLRKSLPQLDKGLSGFTRVQRTRGR